MNVSAYGATAQMQTQAQMQMRRMDGSGNGQGMGQGGMRDIMQSLAPEDRATMKEQLSSLSQEDRASMVSQMQEVDATSMTSDEYFQSLLDILNQEQTTTDTSSAAYEFSVYA